jgi:hypothetical protein
MRYFAPRPASAVITSSAVALSECVDGCVIGAYPRSLFVHAYIVFYFPFFDMATDGNPK